MTDWDGHATCISCHNLGGDSNMYFFQDYTRKQGWGSVPTSGLVPHHVSYSSTSGKIARVACAGAYVIKIQALQMILQIEVILTVQTNSSVWNPSCGDFCVLKSFGRCNLPQVAAVEGAANIPGPLGRRDRFMLRHRSGGRGCPVRIGGRPSVRSAGPACGVEPGGQIRDACFREIGS